MTEQDLWRLEEGFWTGGEDFYERHLSADALMVLPEPAGIMDRGATLESIRSGGRWTDIAFSDQRITRPAEAIVVLVYSAKAARANTDTTYSAQCSSVYVSSTGDWRLALHQQTPFNVEG
jgi:hypothetical protein